MLIKAFGLVFLFIIRLRFPRSQSIADVIRKRYGDRALRNVRKFQRLDYQVRKCQVDIEFLNTCYKHNDIPNFLQFRLTNKTLKDSLTYSICQQLLLSEEIRCKKRCLRQCLNMIVSNRKYSINFHLLILCVCHQMIKRFPRMTKYMVENLKLIPNIHETSV